MKTSELIGEDLDYWVARAEGYASADEVPQAIAGTAYFYGEAGGEKKEWSPSTDWEQGGPLIERERIIVWATTYFVETADLHAMDEQRPQWAALHPNSKGLGGWVDGRGGVDVTWKDGMPGATPLIAAMRAYVASKFGEEVSE